MVDIVTNKDSDTKLHDINTMIYNTGETSEELKAKYNPEGSILRKAQLRMLDMLLYIDKVCKENHIEYCLDGGNILGAVRHGGFIPWDDDVDVTLDRKNYKKLCDYLMRHPHPQYVLQCNATDRQYYGEWSVLRDLKSEYVVDSIVHNVRKYRGLQVDLFPLETGGSAFIHKLICKINRQNSKYFVGRHPKIAQLFFNIQNNVFFPVIRFLSNVLSRQKYFMFPIGTCWHFKLPYDSMRPIGSVTFEGHEFPAPANLEKYLTEHYGDYMKLPPIDKRDHHKAKYKIWD